ncbi:MAG: hypothetical protein JWQ89_2447 [Devosia sp.]|nr:hypothetical protein [Devosia sp.]
MSVTGIFAEVCVADVERSVARYTKFFGRPPEDRPLDGSVQWRDGPDTICSAKALSVHGGPRCPSN